MTGVFFVAVIVILVVFFLIRLFQWALNSVADDLITLFRKDQEKWWDETKLPKAIGRSGFITRAALKYLNKKGVLKKRVVSNDAIKIYPLYPRVGKGHPVRVFLVQLKSLRN